MKSVVEYIEIDVPWCALAYGLMNSSGLCPAVLGVDSAIKCFNTLPTCAVPDSFTPQTVTLRFARPTPHLPDDIDAIPSIREVEFTPAEVSLGEGLGTRATLEIVLDDHPWPDTGEGFDKYVDERPYDPFRQGTFWGKVRARHVSPRGWRCRRRVGLVGQPLDDFVTQHYILDSWDGPRSDGTERLVAKDPIKMLDADRAQAPVMSNGYVGVAIDDAETTMILSPAGVGDEEYPAEGYVTISGNEICAFTRAGDTLTLTRAQFNTEAVQHDSGDRVQLGIYYESMTAAEIIADLETNYVPGWDPDWIPVDDWAEEMSLFWPVLYTRFIAEPTGVRQLVAEMIEQASLVVGWNDREQKQFLQVLRRVSTDADAFTDDDILAGTLRAEDQPDKQVTQVWTYFGVRNPTRPTTDEDNYRTSSRRQNSEAEARYGSPIIRKVFAPYISENGRSVADRLGDNLLSRYADPPRRISFALQRHFGIDSIDLGRGYRVGSRIFQSTTGAEILRPVQSTRITPKLDRIVVEAEEMLQEATSIDPGTVVIDFGQLNVNLRTMHDALWGTPKDPGGGQKYKVVCIINSNIAVGGRRDRPPDWTVEGNLRQPVPGTGLASFDVGDWSDVIAFTEIAIVNRGVIQGAGGAGGDGSDKSQAAARGNPGGEALRTGFPITLDNRQGAIRGGGGGGAGQASEYSPPYGGGGGAGVEPGAGGHGDDGAPDGSDGTALAGGSNTGGAPGRPGRNSYILNPVSSWGGGEGYAIGGESLVTFVTGILAEDNDEPTDGAATRHGSASGEIADGGDTVVSAAIRYETGTSRGAYENAYGEKLTRSALMAALYDSASVTFIGRAADSGNRSAYEFAAQPVGAAAGDRIVDICIAAHGSGVRSISGVTVDGVPVADLSAQVSSDDGSDCTVAGIVSMPLAAGTGADIAVTFDGTMTGCAIQVYRRTGGGPTLPLDTKTAVGSPRLVSRFADAPEGSAVIAVAAAHTASTATPISGIDWTEGEIVGKRAA